MRVRRIGGFLAVRCEKRFDALVDEDARVDGGEGAVSENIRLDSLDEIESQAGGAESVEGAIRGRSLGEGGKGSGGYI